MMGILKKNRSKKGWIRIVEAFIALLLITGTLLVVIDKGYIGKTNIAKQVYQVQIAILREIELNSDFRRAILEVDENDLAIEWNEFEANGLGHVQQRINLSIPDYLECTGRLCGLGEVCSFIDVQNLDRDIFAQAVAIVAERDIYSPKQLKLFCWSS